MSANVLLNVHVLKKLGKRGKIRGLSSILFLFRNEFNNVRFYLSYDIKIILKSYF